MKHHLLLVLSILFLFAIKASSQIFTQGFNGGTMPAGWATAITNDPGADPTITFVSTSLNPAGLIPTEGTHMVKFNSYSCENNASIRLYQTLPFSTVGKTGVTLLFDWATDPQWSTANDRVIVQYSIDGGVTWTDIQTFKRFIAGTMKWNAESVSLPAGGLNQASVLLGFHFIANYGNNCYFDNLIVLDAAEPWLTIAPYSLSFGYTAQGNTSSEKTYTLSGANLNGAPSNITVTAPTDFLISATSGSGYATSINIPFSTATLAPTTIYAVFQPSLPNTDYSGTIANSGGGNSRNVAVSGTSITPYCPSYATGATDEEIFNVTLGTLNNSSTCISTGGSGSILNKYSNYQTLPPADLMKNATYNFKVVLGSCNTYNYGNAIKIFIDYNHDLDFSEANEMVYISPISVVGPHTETGNITIPSTALLGQTVLRVINVETDQPAAIDSCGEYDYGETEDYTVNIILTPSCLPPSAPIASNITLSAADLNWTENGTATSWEIEYGLRGFTPGTGTKVSTNSRPHNIAGLLTSTLYSFRVRSICAVGDTSIWSAFAAFATTCSPNTLPYFENFDDVTAPGMPLCYSVTNNNADANAWATDDYSPYSAPNSATIYYNDAAAMDDWFFTPSFTFEAEKYYQVDFYYSNDGSSTIPEKMAVNWGLSPNSTGMTGGNIFMDEHIENGYSYGIGIIHPSLTAEYYVGFHGYSDAGMNYLTVDNLGIKEVPFSDLTPANHNLSLCDTLGWNNPALCIKNVGNDTLRTGDSLRATYILNEGTPVTEKFIFTSPLYPNDSVTFNFNTQVHFNAFTVYNITYSILPYANDFNILNDTTDFSVSFYGYPIVNIGNDTTLCAEASLVLDAGNPGASYTWWNGGNSQTRLADTSYCGGTGICNVWVNVEQNGCVSTDTLSITWDLCTGINPTPDFAISIMPNPTNGLFTVDFGGLTGTTYVAITDLTGKEALTETLELTGIERATYDLSAYSKGIYNIRIVNNNNVAVRKIVVN